MNKKENIEGILIIINECIIFKIKVHCNMESIYIYVIKIIKYLCNNQFTYSVESFIIRVILRLFNSINFKHFENIHILQ